MLVTGTHSLDNDGRAGEASGAPLVRTLVAGGDPPRHDAVVAALRRPEAYSDGATAVDVVETHRAWVFLTNARAYKLAKAEPDHRHDVASLERRLRSCHEELTLNRRLGGDVYREVVPVVRLQGSYRVARQGPAVEWLIAMRRLPRELMLDVAIADGNVQPQQVDALAEVLLSFYARAEPAPMTGPEYRRRLLDDIDAKCSALVRPHYGVDPSGPEGLATALRAWVARHGPQLDSRARTIVDAHGDLRPEHVCLEPQPVIIDCLEFERDLRLLDPASELSFFALECRRLGADWIGARLLAHAALRLGPTSRELTRFYQGYHALVRAAVAIWHLDDRGQGHHDRWRQRAEQYVRLGLDEVGPALEASGAPGVEA